jgi:RNA polymerase sigma-70 factor, ECF subfamily
MTQHAMTTGSVTAMVVTDRAAWQETRRRLLAFVARRVENRDTAEDIVQDVLERVHRGDLSDVVDLDAWLYRTARNAIVDHYRRRRPFDPLDGDDPVVPDEPDEPAEAVQELARCLRPLIAALPADYAQALQLVDLGPHTHEAAARIAGVSTSGMKSRVQRGRRRLGELLHQCCAIEVTRTGAVEGVTGRQDACSC